MQDSAQTQVNYLKNILTQGMTAMNFIEDIAADKLEELKDSLAWRKYEELGYEFATNELF